MRYLPGGAGSPISRMPQQQKAGYVQHTSPFLPNTTKILNLLIEMKKDNKSDYTINFTRKALTYLSKHTSLSEPEALKLFISTLKTSDGYKRKLCIAYNKYVKFCKLSWNMPIYREEAKNIALPTKEKLLMLIANAGNLLSMNYH